MKLSSFMQLVLRHIIMDNETATTDKYSSDNLFDRNIMYEYDDDFTSQRVRLLMNIYRPRTCLLIHPSNCLSTLAGGTPARSSRRGTPPWVPPIRLGWRGTPTPPPPLSDLARGYPGGGYPTLGTPDRPGRGYPDEGGTPPWVPPSDLAEGGTPTGGTPPCTG